MILYHGTSSKKLNSILKRGLRPRGLSRKDAGWGNYPSAIDRIYITDCYAFFFSFNAASIFKGDPIVFEIEIPEDDEMVMKKLVPDEDALAQSNCKDMPWLDSLSLVERTKYWQLEAPRFPQLAIPSLEALGTCAIMGSIPWKTEGRKGKHWGITKYVNVPDDFCLRFDPTISLLNHKVMGERYHKALKQFVDSDGTDMSVTLQTEQELKDIEYLTSLTNNKKEELKWA